jgi:hypothetical protein
MELPKGVSMSVPDLSKFGPQAPSIDFSHVAVHPGESVMVVLPRTTNMQQLEQVKQMFMQWEPRVNWMVVAGVEQVVQVTPAPVEDKTPQGRDDVVMCNCAALRGGHPHPEGQGYFCHDEEPDDVGYMGWMQGQVPYVETPVHDDSNCPGPPECM